MQCKRTDIVTWKDKFGPDTPKFGAALYVCFAHGIEWCAACRSTVTSDTFVYNHKGTVWCIKCLHKYVPDHMCDENSWFESYMLEKQINAV